MREQDEKKSKIMEWVSVENIIILLHFLLTFVFERVCFVFDNNFTFVNEIARNDYVSDRFELVLVYLLSKVCAGIIIYFFWKMVFHVINHRIPKSTVLLFGVIFLIGVFMGVCQYPNMFSLAIDNYTTYAQAIRFIPTYWQSVYTGVVYAGSMMVIPHPFSIYFFQWALFVGVIGYIYDGVEKMFDSKNLKYVTLLLFFLPESYYLVFDAYRNNYFAMLCIFYFAYIFFSLRKADHSFRIKELVSIALLSAFIAVWRSEGVLVGLGGVVLLFFVYKTNWKRALVFVGVFCSALLLFNTVQGIGAKKYYGKDYSIVNTTDVLRNILNDPNSNFAYVGVEEDFAALEAVVPVQVLKEAGMNGFRNYNWTNGRPNFNQTLANDEDASAYMAAYYRMIWNNLPGYLNVQTNAFFSAMKVDVSRPIYWYTGVSFTNLETFQYDRWLIGQEELESTPLTGKWIENPRRIKLYGITAWLLSVWGDMWTQSGISRIVHVMVLVADVFLLIWSILKAVLEKEKKYWEYIMYFTIILGEFAALFLFMPTGRAEYLYPMLYSSYVVLFLIFAERKCGIKRKSAE